MNRNYRGHCAVAVMAQRILDGLRKETLDDLCRLPPSELTRILCWHSISIRDAQDAWAVERALIALDRVFTLHRRYPPDTGFDRMASTATVPTGLCTSSSFASERADHVRSLHRQIP